MKQYYEYLEQQTWWLEQTQIQNNKEKAIQSLEEFLTKFNDPKLMHKFIDAYPFEKIKPHIAQLRLKWYGDYVANWVTQIVYDDKWDQDYWKNALLIEIIKLKTWIQNRNDPSVFQSERNKYANTTDTKNIFHRRYLQAYLYLHWKFDGTKRMCLECDGVIGARSRDAAKWLLWSAIGANAPKKNNKLLTNPGINEGMSLMNEKYQMQPESIRTQIDSPLIVWLRPGYQDTQAVFSPIAPMKIDSNLSENRVLNSNQQSPTWVSFDKQKDISSDVNVTNEDLSLIQNTLNYINKYNKEHPSPISADMIAKAMKRSASSVISPLLVTAICFMESTMWIHTREWSRAYPYWKKNIWNVSVASNEVPTTFQDWVDLVVEHLNYRFDCFRKVYNIEPTPKMLLMNTWPDGKGFMSDQANFNAPNPVHMWSYCASWSTGDKKYPWKIANIITKIENWKYA